MIYTSHFANPSLLFFKGKKVSIARSVPQGVQIDGEMPEAMPSAELLKAYKKHDCNEREYCLSYWSALQIAEIAAALSAEKQDIVLLCWEKDGFCHRHLLAASMVRIGVEVREMLHMALYESVECSYCNRRHVYGVITAERGREIMQSGVPFRFRYKDGKGNLIRQVKCRACVNKSAQLKLFETA